MRKLVFDDGRVQHVALCVARDISVCYVQYIV
jgi:hypothetical protein